MSCSPRSPSVLAKQAGGRSKCACDQPHLLPRGARLRTSSSTSAPQLGPRPASCASCLSVRLFCHEVHGRLLAGVGRTPSTGLLAVAVALRMCAHVEVYGFGGRSSSSCYYYYDCSRRNAQYISANRFVAVLHRVGAVCWRLFTHAILTVGRSRLHSFEAQIDRLGCWNASGRLRLRGEFAA